MARSRPRNEAAFEAAYARERARGNSEAYSKRIASAEARGIPRQKARGHVEREHIRRREKDVETGRLTQADKRWIEQQKKRVNYDGASQAGKDRFDAGVEAFKNMTPEERFEVRLQQMQRQNSTMYASVYPATYGDQLAPLYLSSRSGLR